HTPLDSHPSLRLIPRWTRRCFDFETRKYYHAPLMSQRTVIESASIARESGAQQGEVRIAELTRLRDLLADPSGCLRYRLDGKVGPRDRLQLLLQVDGMLSICCQRCLEGIDNPVAIKSLLEFVDDEDLTQEEIEDDTKDFLPVVSELDVVALIEDEVLLDLPYAPRHESCVLPAAARETGTISPFSVLKGLIGKAR
ncbi:MAG: YceD family protein, partial [Propionivibrio sp.]